PRHALPAPPPAALGRRVSSCPALLLRAMPSARTALSVNLNKVALLRNARDLDLPSVEHAARVCLDAGADGLTVHPRPDGRHIRPHDVPALAQLLAGHRAEFHIDGNPFAAAGH